MRGNVPYFYCHLRTVFKINVLGILVPKGLDTFQQRQF